MFRESVEERAAGIAQMKTGNYSATINGVVYKVLLFPDGIVEVDGTSHVCDLRMLDENAWSLIVDGRTFMGRRTTAESGEVPSSDGGGTLGRTVSLTIDEIKYAVRIDDARSLLVRSLFSQKSTTSGIYAVKAPMPGLISRIEVEVGSEVLPGTALLVLEAMKMENEIKSQKKGRVTSINIERGKAVEKGELLITVAEL